jgi:hypothetical protein
MPANEIPIGKIAGTAHDSRPPPKMTERLGVESESPRSFGAARDLTSAVSKSLTGIPTHLSRSTLQIGLGTG